MKSRLTSIDVSRVVGTQLPEDFVRLVRLAVNRRGTRGFESFTEEPLGMFLGGRWMSAVSGRSRPSHDVSYPQTPPELIPIGTMRVDGVHYGFIVRSPELPAADIPVGELSPMDFGPVTLLGSSLAEAVENLASEQMAYRDDDDVDPMSAQGRRDLDAICRLLSISPSIKKSERRYTRGGDGRPIPIPKGPRNYQFRPTLDGVGVHAPRDAFAPKSPRFSANQLAESLHASKKLLERGYPASALAILKDAWWEHCESALSIAPLITECYRQLNRPFFADSIERAVSKLQRSPSGRG